MPTLETMQRAAGSLGLQTKTQNGKLKVGLRDGLWLVLAAGKDGLDTTTWYGWCPEWLWYVLMVMPAVGFGYYVAVTKLPFLSWPTAFLFGLCMFSLAVLLRASRRVGRMKSQLFSRADELAPTS